MWSATEWPVWTGTRTVVAATSRSGRSRILRSSALTLRSSPLHPSSKRRSIWGTTESAIRPWNGGLRAAASAAVGARSATNASTRPAGPTHRLVGGHVHRLQPGEIADGGEGDHGRRGRAVRVRHQPPGVADQRDGVGLGHDQRNSGVEAVGARVVDHERNGSGRALHQRPRDLAVGGQEQDVELGGRVLVQHRDRHLGPVVGDRAGIGPEGAQEPGRQAGIGQDGQEDAAHHPAGAGHPTNGHSGMDWLPVGPLMTIGRSPRTSRARSA